MKSQRKNGLAAFRSQTGRRPMSHPKRLEKFRKEVPKIAINSSCISFSSSYDFLSFACFFEPLLRLLQVREIASDVKVPTIVPFASHSGILVAEVSSHSHEVIECQLVSCYGGFERAIMRPSQ